MNIKTGTALALLAFAITLAYYVSSRLSTDALNLAVGVLCGMGASIPVSLGLLLALLRQRERTGDDELDRAPDFRDFPAGSPGALRPAHPQAPPIIVIAPPQTPYGQAQSGFGYPMSGAGFAGYPPAMNEDVVDSRDWRIIGDDEG